MTQPDKDDLYIRWLGLEVRARGLGAIVAVVVLALVGFAKYWFG
jgi:hypothetical protein